jgi:hypothetical protein
LYIYKLQPREPALTPDWDTATRWLGPVHSPLHSFGAHIPDPPIKRYAIKLNR